MEIELKSKTSDENKVGLPSADLKWQDIEPFQKLIFGQAFDYKVGVWVVEEKGKRYLQVQTFHFYKGRSTYPYPEDHYTLIPLDLLKKFIERQ